MQRKEAMSGTRQATGKGPKADSSKANRPSEHLQGNTSKDVVKAKGCQRKLRLVYWVLPKSV